jgi:hypothetical protein
VRDALVSWTDDLHGARSSCSTTSPAHRANFGEVRLGLVGSPAALASPIDCG